MQHRTGRGGAEHESGLCCVLSASPPSLPHVGPLAVYPPWQVASADRGPDLLSRTARSLVDAHCAARTARRSAAPPSPRVSTLRAMKELRLDGRLGVIGHGHGKHAAGFCAVCRHALALRSEERTAAPPKVSSLTYMSMC